MMKSTKLFLLSLLLGVGGYGVFTSKAEVFNLKLTDINGVESVFSVDNDLKMKINDNSLCLSTAKDSVAIHLNDLREIKYEKTTPSGITVPVNERPYVRITHSGIIINGNNDSTKAPANLRIFNDSGKLLYSTVCREATVIQLTPFPKGIYILNIDNLPSVKFVVK